MRRPALIVATMAACTGEPAAGFSSGGPGVTSVDAPASTGGGSSSSSTSGAEDSTAGAGGSSSSAASVPDMGMAPDFGPAQPPGCKGKIDFLFVISREGNMITEQAQLLASLPGFIATIEASFPEFDTHIMVANPDGTWNGWACEVPAKYCGAEPYNCEPYAPGYACNSWELLTDCDEKLGAGLLFNVGPTSYNHSCALAGGRRYMVVPGEPAPDAAFECIARVGTYGPNPPMGEALVAAVSPALNADDGCNAGFLRPDALLVVTMITDLEDQVSKTKPADWYAAVVKAKGDPGAVVMLAIQPQPLRMGEEPTPGCSYNSDGKLRLRDLIRMFPFHAEGDICAPSYAPLFEDAVGLVAEACGAFVPQ